jgi:hypothetical protein
MESFGNFEYLLGKKVHIPKWKFQGMTTLNTSRTQHHKGGKLIRRLKTAGLSNTTTHKTQT